MKKKLYSALIIILIIFLIINIFINSNKLPEIINFSINLFIKNIFPSLFPMFIISSLLVNIDIPIILGNIFKKPINKLFKTNQNAAFVFFMSMITGFPSSAKYIEDLMQNNKLTKKDSEKILTFTFFSNPLFIVNTVGNIFYKNIKIGYIMLISHIIGNIITGIIFRNYNKKDKIENQTIKSSLSHLNKKINETNLIKLLIKSIKESLEILINIFGIITFILIIINIIFKDQTKLINIILIGLTEMTTGIKLLTETSIDLNIKLYLTMFFISFGGISVHLQIFSILTKRKVKYLPFLISRILHGIISIIIMKFLF